jgi:acyl-ACP thioesterase
VLDPALRPRLDAVAPVAAQLPAPGSDAQVRRFDVRYADIDLNRHVNNASYVAWALECVAPERWASARAACVEAHYLAEALYGDAIAVRTEEQGGALVHLVAREDGKELARLRTAWVAR